MPRIAEEARREDPLAEQRLRCLLGLLFGYAYDRLQNAAQAAADRRIPLDRLRGLVASDVQRRWAPAELAAELNLSATYFTRLFTAQVGYAPRRWLVEQRIHGGRALKEKVVSPFKILLMNLVMRVSSCFATI